MSVTTIDTGALRALRNDLNGEVLVRDDAGYERARGVYNAIHERWPALVVRAADAADVAATVRFAAEEGLLLAVRGGNHSMRGHGSCDDGVVLDLSALRAVEVDAGTRRARVGGGATWADVNAGAHAHGLATTGGLISTTGVGGLTLGGGFGYLTRRLGLACDNIVRAEVVMADGRTVVADEEREPELFWGLRGGGGNFGVVTSFTYALSPVGEVLAGPLVFDPDEPLVERFAAFLADAPRELGAILGLTLAPPLPFLPVEAHGRACAVVVACWSGDPARGAEVLAGLAGIGRLRGQGIRTMPYPEINTLFDGLLPPGIRHYWKSAFVRAPAPAAVRAWVEHGGRTPTVESGIFLYPVDGAAHDVASAATAWPHRHARFLVGYHGSWREPADDAALRAWVDAAHADAVPHTDGGAYVNFASGPDHETADYGPHAARLVALKRRRDPHNLFCLNANIDPDGRSA